MSKTIIIHHNRHNILKLLKDLKIQVIFTSNILYDYLDEIILNGYEHKTITKEFALALGFKVHLDFLIIPKGSKAILVENDNDVYTFNITLPNGRNIENMIFSLDTSFEIKIEDEEAIAIFNFIELIENNLNDLYNVSFINDAVHIANHIQIFD